MHLSTAAGLRRPRTLHPRTHTCLWVFFISKVFVLMLYGVAPSLVRLTEHLEPFREASCSQEHSQYVPGRKRANDSVRLQIQRKPDSPFPCYS